MAVEPATEPFLAIRDLDAFYGAAHVLQKVNIEMGRESVAIVGRNGMGKTTLCNALMQIRPPAVRGSIRFQGQELVGLPSHRVARAGIGFIPQGRRLFGSLTVDEHLRMIAPHAPGQRWTIDSIYELFPRLGERKRSGGMQLSGGEQQMLAIGRALLTNPQLLIMDEPSEGLAPAITEMLIATFKTLASEGLAILVVEQKLSVAISLAERLLVMVGGRIAIEMTSEEMASDADAQRRWLGVEVATDPEPPSQEPAPRRARKPAARKRPD